MNLTMSKQDGADELNFIGGNGRGETQMKKKSPSMAIEENFLNSSYTRNLESKEHNLRQ